MSRTGAEVYRQVLRTDDPQRKVKLLEDAVTARNVVWDFPSISDVWEALADAYGQIDEYDAAIRAFEKSVELGWRGVPDPRSKLADFHLRAGRRERAATLLAEARDADPDELWLYLDAGFTYVDAGLDEIADRWFADGIRQALATDGDPDEVLGELVEARAETLLALGRRPDMLQLDAVERLNSLAPLDDDWPPTPWPPAELRPEQRPTVAIPVLVAAEWDQAVARWPEEFDEPTFLDYAHVIESAVKAHEAAGWRIAGLAPVILNRYLAWCASGGHDPAESESRAAYAAACSRDGLLIRWPPGRNDACWCESGSKYKRCCGPIEARRS